MSLTYKVQESKILRGLLDNFDAGCPRTHKKQCLDNCTNIGSLSMKIINTQSTIRIEERFVCMCGFFFFFFSEFGGQGKGNKGKVVEREGKGRGESSR